MKIAVIGAGWAGMAAAHRLQQSGHDVTVFEVSHQLGGRARGLDDSQMGRLDNGQHLLIGAYIETLKLIDWAARQEREALIEPALPTYVRVPLSLRSADGVMALAMDGSSGHRSVHDAFRDAPHGVVRRLLALARAKGLTVTDRLRAAWLLAGLRLGWNNPSMSQSVSQWLGNQRQSANLCNRLWIPLCLATMNTPAHHACARLFARILKDSLLSDKPGATDLIIPARDLTALWIEAVSRRVRVLRGVQISTIQHGERQNLDRTIHHQIEVNAEQFDGCIIATPPASTRRIVEQWDSSRSESLLKQLAAFEFLPITTCYIDLAEPFRLPEPMLMLSSGHPGNLSDKANRTPFDKSGIRTNDEGATATRADNLGQWVFDRNAVLEDSSKGRLAFVISHAGTASLDRDHLAQALIQQLADELSKSLIATHRILAQSLPPIAASRIFTEKRATFAATPGLQRPSCNTAWPHIKLAGDWTDTGYPAVLEGAVISGLKAAEALDASLRSPQEAPAKTGANSQKPHSLRSGSQGKARFGAR